MPSRKIAGNPAHDATMPTVDVTIHGGEYHLAFTFAALSLAKKALVKQGVLANILIGCDIRSLDIDTLPVMLFAALITAHPEITYKQVESLLDMKTHVVLADAVVHAYLLSIEQPKEDAPKNADAEE